MSKKGENIRKRKDGRWEARYIKFRTADGKIHYGYLYGKSYREVREKKQTAVAQTLVMPALRDDSLRMLKDKSVLSISLYWRKHIRYTVKESTYSNYDAILNNHIVPVIGACPVPAITNESISKVLQSGLESGLSPGSLQAVMSVLRNMLHYTEEYGLSTAEPLKFPHFASGSKNINIMSKDDYRKLELFLINKLNDFEFGLLLCMYTGIRVGELSGLKWEDIDLNQGKIYIRRTVTRVKNIDNISAEEGNSIPKTTLHIGPPKTITSIREIPLPDKLLDYANKLRKNPKYFLLSASEKCMEPRNIQRRYHSILRQCNIPPVKIHALRHHFSCRWIEQGFDTKSLSEILGHTSVKTTLDLYVHIRPEVKRSYMNQLAEA